MATISCDWYDLPCVTSGALDWFSQAALWVPRKVYSLLLDGLASVVESFPRISAADTFAQNAGTALSGAAYFVDYFAINTGLSMIASALLLRFLLRRIPLIG